MRILVFLALFLVACAPFRLGVDVVELQQTSGVNFVSRDVQFPLRSVVLRKFYYPINPDPVVLDDKLVYFTRNGKIHSYNLSLFRSEDMFLFPQASNVPFVFTDSLVLVSLGHGKDNVQLYNHRDERIVFKKTIPTGVESKPILTKNRVIVASAKGDIFGLEANSGKEVWRVKTKKPIHADLTLTDNAIIAANDAGQVLKLDVKTGEVLWSECIDEQPIYSKPLVLNNVIWIASTSGKLHRIQLATGELISHSDFSAPFFANPAADGDAVYIGNNDSHLYKFDFSGNQVWAFQTVELVKAQPLIGRSYVYFGDGNGTFYIVDKETAEKKYEKNFKGRFIASPVFWENKLIVFTDNDDIYLLENDSRTDDQASRLF
jgi:outer membrane protein assembly factor BamB